MRGLIVLSGVCLLSLEPGGDKLSLASRPEARRRGGKEARRQGDGGLSLASRL